MENKETIKTEDLWKEPHETLKRLRKEDKKDSIEFHEAYARYFEAMTKTEGDSNGYYWGCIKEHRLKAMKLHPDWDSELSRVISERIRDQVKIQAKRLNVYLSSIGIEEDLTRFKVTMYIDKECPAPPKEARIPKNAKVKK
jgi:hypothetical protein